MNSSSTSPTRAPSSSDDGSDGKRSSSIIRRSLVAASDFLSPFSPAALASLPNLRRPARYNRADAIPDADVDDDGQRPTIRDYHSINSLPPQVRIPKKFPTPIKVEAKVWFANERTWIAWLNVSILLGTLSLALFNASKDQIATNFAYVYALTSIATVIYAFMVYQHRISMIRRRDPGHFDSIAGPIVLGIILFTAILVNFVVRVREMKRKEIPIPGTGLFTFNKHVLSLFFHTRN